MNVAFKRISAMLFCLALVFGFFALTPNSFTSVQAEEDEPVNLITFGDFEMSQSIPGWTIGAVEGITLEYRAAKTGKLALRMDDASKTDSFAVPGTKVDVTAGTRYTAAVQVKGATGAQIVLNFYNVAGEVVGSAKKETAAKFSSWVRISCNAVAPEGATKAEVTLGTTAACNGTVYFDDAELIGKDDNLLTNPGFESAATFSDWTITGAGEKTVALSTGMAHAGNGALYTFDNSNMAVNIKSSMIPIRSNMIGQILDFSYYIYGIGVKQSNGMVNTVPSIFIQFVDASGKDMPSSTRIMQTGSYYESWTRRVTAGTIPEGATHFYIWISSGTSTIGESLVDDIVVSIRCDHTSLTYTEITPAKCDAPGSESAVCPLCEKNVVREIPALSHDYDQGVISVAPKCEETGKIQYTCRNCQSLIIEDVPVAGHDMTHVPATATNIEYWTCSCGKWFEDAEGEYEIQIKDSVNIGGTSSTNPTTPSASTPTIPTTAPSTTVAPTTPSASETPTTSGTQADPTTPAGGQPGDTSDKTPILFFGFVMVVALAAFVFTKQIRRKG